MYTYVNVICFVQGLLCFRAELNLPSLNLIWNNMMLNCDKAHDNRGFYGLYADKTCRSSFLINPNSHSLVAGFNINASVCHMSCWSWKTRSLRSLLAVSKETYNKVHTVLIITHPFLRFKIYKFVPRVKTMVPFTNSLSGKFSKIFCVSGNVCIRPGLQVKEVTCGPWIFTKNFTELWPLNVLRSIQGLFVYIIHKSWREFILTTG